MTQTREQLTRLGDRLDSLLARQRAQLRQRFLVHGLGWVVAAATSALVVYYLADRGLRLPIGVRILASIGVAVFLLLAVRRRVLYPLSRSIGRDDVAVAFERRFPDLAERLISAVQLTDQVRRDSDDAGSTRTLRNQSEAMIAKVVEEAAASAEALPHSQLYNPRRTLRVWAVAACGLLVAIAGVLLEPAATKVFVKRILGFDVAYPRETTLRLQLPDDPQSFLIERQGQRARVTMAAGDDLPVLVQAEGIVPREVFLIVEGGRGTSPQLAMTARGGGLFKHSFRRVAGNLSFHARGGDDDRGDLEVEVVTLFPPRVATVRAVLEPPAYTGLPPAAQAGGAIEALEGTRVDIAVVATSPVARAKLVFLETGLEVALAERVIEDDDGQRTVQAGSFIVTKSDRYQVELISPEGLHNPHPGHYPVVALADHAPVGRVLLPTSDELNVVLPGGVLPLRVEMLDDYGLAQAQALFEVGKDRQVGKLELLPASQSTAPRRVVVTELLPLDQLPIEGAKLSVGDTLSLGIHLGDIKQPVAMTTELPPREIFVVGDSDLARRISGHFRRIREEVERAYTLQQDRHDRLDDVAQALQAGDDRDAVRNDLAIVQVGQARVLGLGKRIRDELIRSFNLHLFNGLEASPHAETVRSLFLQYHRQNTEAVAAAPAFYVDLGEQRRTGAVGSMPKTLDPILAMILSASAVADTLSPRAVRLMDRSAIEPTAEATAQTLAEAAKAQEDILTELVALRDKLDEWNEFQDVVAQTRALRDKQRDVQSRTQEALKGAGK